MADFDPYYQWLAIPPKDQPPNHYRLLGVELFESNTEAIANAADQRMVHLRSFQTGKHADLSQKLLNEIALAQVCLLNPEKKIAYDRQLRQQLAVPPVLPPPPPISAPHADQADFQNAPPIASSATPPAMARLAHLSDKKPVWLGLGLLGGAAFVLVAVLIVKLGLGGKEVASTEPKPSSAATIPPDQEPDKSEPGQDLKEPKLPEPWHGPPAGETGRGQDAQEIAHAQDARAAMPTTPPDRPPQADVKARPSADSGQPGNANPQKLPESRPSTAGTTHSQPEGSRQGAVPESKEPPSKGPFPAEAKPQPTGPEARPPEKPAAADPAARAREAANPDTARAAARETGGSH